MSGKTTGGSNVGGILGEAYSKMVTIEGATVSGDIKGNSNVGGVIGNGGLVTLRDVKVMPIRLEATYAGVSYVNMIIGSGTSHVNSVIENTRYYITGQVEPTTALLYADGSLIDESLIERTDTGFVIAVPVSKSVGTTEVTNNRIDSLWFMADGYSSREVPMSLDNGRKIYDLALVPVVLEIDSIEAIEGLGTAASPFIINNLEQFKKIAMLVSQGISLSGVVASEAYYELSKDLDLSSYAGFTGLGSQVNPFKGHLDGKGFTINLSIENKLENVAGFIRYGEGASISNLQLTGSVTGLEEVGGLIGRGNDITVSQVHSEVAVTGTKYVGGLVGEGTDILMEDSRQEGKVTGVTMVGGIVGKITRGSFDRVYAVNTPVIYTGGSSGGNIYGQLISSSLVNTYVGFSSHMNPPDPYVDITGYEDISVEYTIKVVRDTNKTYIYVPVNELKNNYTQESTVTFSKEGYYSRTFTLKEKSKYEYINRHPNVVLAENNQEKIPLAIIKIKEPVGAMISESLRRVTGLVSSTVDSLIIDLEVGQGATWKLFSDAGCTSEITDKKMILAWEDNKAYIKLTSGDGKTEKTYGLFIHRERVKPRMITGLEAMSKPEQVDLSWNKAYEANVTGYRIYRSMEENSGYIKLFEVVGRHNVTFIDKTAQIDRQYFYKVTAVDEFNVESPLSDMVSGVAGVDDVLPVVLGMSPANGSRLGKDTRMTVVAEDNIGVKSIRLEYFSEDIWKTIDVHNISGNYKHATVYFYLKDIEVPSGEFIFRAIAVDLKGNESVGDLERTYIVDLEGPEPVINLAGYSLESGILLSWSDVADEDFSYFLVEEKKGTEETFRQIATVYTKLGYQVTNTTPDADYYYRVLAVDDLGNRGEYSEIIHVKTLGDGIKPVISSILPRPNYFATNIPLAIRAQDDVVVTQLIIETSLQNKDWVEVETITLETPKATIEKTYDLDISAIREGSIFVRAFAVDGYGNRSEASSIVEYKADRTPPSKPLDLSLEAEVNQLILRWPFASEMDVKAYSIYRSEGDASDFILVSKATPSLGYIDASVKPGGVTYFYSIKAIDGAGNESIASDMVSGELIKDTQAPKIHYVTPDTGSKIGRQAQFHLAISDNSELKRVVAEYKVAGQWQEIDSTTVSGEVDYALLTWNNEDISLGEQTLRFVAFDEAGNQSDDYVCTYVLEATELLIPNLIATPGNLNIELSWQEAKSDRVVGYNLYKEEKGKDILLTSIIKGNVLSFIDHRLEANQSYTYFIESVDIYGNTARGDTVSTVPLNIDGYAPIAKAGFSTNTLINIETSFDGSDSTDNVGIVSYAWDFGDGETAKTKQTNHVFSETGVFDVRLTVEDAAGNKGVDSIQVEVLQASGKMLVKVIDRNTGQSIGGASVHLDYKGRDRQFTTNYNGEVEIPTQAGSYRVSAYKKDYLPNATNAKVYSTEVTRVTIGIERGDLVAGNITTKRLTLEEIIAEGIDITAPENQYIYRFTVTLVFEKQPLKFDLIGNGEGTILKPKHPESDPDSDGTVIKNGNRYTPQLKPLPGYVEVTPTFVVVRTPATANILKEFFEVAVFIQNMADPEFIIGGNSLNLNLPAGLSLAKEDSLRKSLPDLEGGDFATEKWIIRGDTEGSYDISADFTGTLYPFQAPINHKLVADQPIKIYGGEGLELHIQVPSSVNPKNKKLNMTYTVANYSDIPRYQVGLTLGEGIKRVASQITMRHPVTGKEIVLGMKPRTYTLNTASDASMMPILLAGDSFIIKTLLPGEAASGVLSLDFPAGTNYYDYVYKLTKLLFGEDPANTIQMKVTVSTQPFYLDCPINTGTKECGLNGIDTTGRSATQVNASDLLNSRINIKLNNDSGFNQSKDKQRSFSEPHLFAAASEDREKGIPKETESALGKGGWFTNYDMKIVDNDNGHLNLYYSETEYITFVHEDQLNGIFTGTQEADGEPIQVERRANSTGTYQTLVPGYEKHHIEKLADGSFTLQDAGPNLYILNEDGILTEIEDASGVSTYYIRQGVEVVVSKEDSDATLTLRFLDNQLVDMINEDGEKASFTYNELGQLVEMKSAKDRSTAYTYDEYNRITSKKEGKKEVHYTYDELDRVIRETDTYGNSTEIIYEDINLTEVKMTVIDKNGYESVTIADAFGRVVKKIDALGSETVYVYDEYGNVSMGVMDGYRMMFEYDEANRLVKTTDDSAATQSTTYDENGKITKSTAYDGRFSENSYNDQGYLIQTVNENGLTSRYVYNEDGHILSETIDGLGGNSYLYAGDNLIETTDKNGNKEHYTYDSDNNMLTSRDMKGRKTTYTYNGAGNILTVTNEEGVITRIYDKLNQVISITNVHGQTIGFAYDVLGNVTSITYPYGEMVSYTYDLNSLLTKVVDYRGRETSYTYNNEQQLIETRLPDGSVEVNIYDLKGQLTETTLTLGTGEVKRSSYVYDGAGRIVSEKQPIPLNPTITADVIKESLETQMTYEKNNALATYKGEPVSYDKDGNMTVGPLGKSMVNYTYNQFNLLTEVDGTYYKYDGEGRRVSQMDDMGRTTQYVTNPHSSFSELLLSIDPEGIETIYVYGLGLISEEKSDGGRLSNYRVYHYDYRGSTNFLTSGEGKVTDSFIYGAYGELLRQSGDTQTIFMYNGKYGVVTDENGLYYMRARYYNPQIKRFINIDPIKDSYNWFAFVEGDPVRFIDPWGLVKIKVNGNEVDAIDIMDDGKLWANPLSLAKAAGFDISNVGNIVRITSGDNYVHLSGVAYVDEQQQTHYFHTTGASYNTTIHNDHFTGKLTVQGSLVDAKAFIMHLNCSLVGAIDWGEGNGDTYYKNGSITSSYKSKAEMYRFTEMKICTDGSIDYDGQANHQRETAYFLGSYLDPIYMNPVKMHYVVIPMNYAGNAKKGDIAVVIDKNTGNYVYAIIGDVGPNDKYEEVSISAAWDLGFKTDGTYGPVGDFEYILFPETKIDWGTDIDVLQEKINQEGKKYYNIGGA